MTTVLWDCKSEVLLKFMPHKSAVTGKYIATVMKALHNAQES
jgi:hypothetical protein